MARWRSDRYVLTGLAALAALAVTGQAMARQTVAERADHQALSTLGVRPREFVLLALLRALLTSAAGTAGAVLVTVLVSGLTPVGERITTGAFVEVNVNGQHVRTIAMTPVRGTALLSVPDGRLPRGDRDIMLGVATMRATGAQVGGTVQVTVADPDGKPHVAGFRVTGRASLNAGTGGLGNGAVMTTSAFINVQCPAGSKRSACQQAVRNCLATVALVRAAPGAAGSAALARHVKKYPTLTYQPAEPEVLVNFGESVNFPLLLALALAVFGAATLLHLLLVSVARRRVEAGLLKALGFVRRQVAATVCWQASVVALVGIAIGVPAGIAAGRVLWRVFATNFGVVPVAVVEPVLIIALVAGVLAVANLLAAAPALLAARSDPARLLMAE